jgi:hypothetical protein
MAIPTGEADMTDPNQGSPKSIDPIAQVQDALNRLRFGAIQLTVHEGKLVQLDVTERKRFPS